MPSRGARRILVDGVPFRWAVRRRPTYHQGNGWAPLTFVVEAADQPGAPLVVTTSAAHPGNWMGLPAGTVRPAMVGSAIRRALDAGWRPGRPGPAVPLHIVDLDSSTEVTEVTRE